MADRKNFYYRQKVLEAELDGAFDGLESADLALALDQDLCARTPPADKSSYGGITTGFTVTHAGDLDFNITAGSAYDEQGRRAATASTLQLTVSNQGDTAIGAAGTPAGASAEPTLGNERWVSAYLVYDRLESDERYDGYNYPVLFERAESFHFNVVAGTEKSIGSLLDADKPARESGKLLVFDARIKNEAGTTVYVSHDVDRKEWFLNLTAANAPHLTIENKGNVRDAVKILLDHINDHVGGLTNLHPASVIETTITSLWADGVKGAYGLSTVLSDALNNLMEDLNSTTEPAGVKHLGAKAQAPGLTTPPPSQASPAELSAGTLEDQLTELLEAVNGRIFRGGDSGIAGVLSPETDGTALGTTANSWDVLARDLTVKGDLRSDLKPVIDGMGNLGAPLRRFSDIYTNSLTAYVSVLLSDADLTVNTGTVELKAGSTLHYKPEDTAGDLISLYDNEATPNVIAKWHNVVVGAANKLKWSTGAQLYGLDIAPGLELLAHPQADADNQALNIKLGTASDDADDSLGGRCAGVLDASGNEFLRIEHCGRIARPMLFEDDLWYYSTPTYRWAIVNDDIGNSVTWDQNNCGNGNALLNPNTGPAGSWARLQTTMCVGYLTNTGRTTYKKLYFTARFRMGYQNGETDQQFEIGWGAPLNNGMAFGWRYAAGGSAGQMTMFTRNAAGTYIESLGKGTPYIPADANDVTTGWTQVWCVADLETNILIGSITATDSLHANNGVDAINFQDQANSGWEGAKPLFMRCKSTVGGEEPTWQVDYISLWNTELKSGPKDRNS